MSNLERYKKDLDALLSRGEKLQLAMTVECFPEETLRILKEKHDEEAEKALEPFPLSKRPIKRGTQRRRC